MRNAYMASSYFQLYRYGTGHPLSDAGTPFSVILQSCLCQHVKDRLRFDGLCLKDFRTFRAKWRISGSNR